MVRIGIIGIGFMGVTHFKAIEKVKGAKVAAICTRDARKLKGDWRKVQGNFGGSGGVQDLTGVAQYREIDGILADPKVDMVNICLPSNMHVEWTLKALAAGKHVFLEKPIALTVADADRLVKAAAGRRRLLMVAHVLRYFPQFKLIADLKDSKEYGKVVAAHFKRVTARPFWWDSFDLSRTGGPAIDLHIHDSDFVQFLFGMPKAVTSSGVITKGLVEHINTHYHFNRGPVVSAHSGWLAKQGCPFEHGYDVYFDEATLKFNSSSGEPPALLTADGKVRKPRVSKVDGFVGEIQEAVDAVVVNRVSPVLSGRSARDSLKLVLREIQSAKQGRRVAV